MKKFNLHHLGRFGNQMFGYAFARGYCERHGLELHTDPWVGEEIFCLEHPRCTEELPRRDEYTLIDGEGGISYRSYSQNQKCADYYSQRQLREWFKLKPKIAERLSGLDGFVSGMPIRAHIRRGDFRDYGYPLISRDSYFDAAHEWGLRSAMKFISDEDPHELPELPDFLPDFYLLMTAKVLLRANSSFSFWAAALSDALVLSPLVTGLEGGKEHNVKFTSGNHNRLSDHSFVSEIHISP